MLAPTTLEVAPWAVADETWYPCRATGTEVRAPRPECRNPHHRQGVGSDHVNISPERDTLARISAAGPWPGSATSWRGTPRCTVNLTVLSAVLLVCLALLLGASWTVQALQPKLRRQADERRRLNAEWSAVRAARRQFQLGECPRCAIPLSERDGHEHRVLHAMHSGIAYDLPQVSSVSGTILSQTSSALDKLRDQGYVETLTDPVGTVRYKKIVPKYGTEDDD